MTVTDGIDVEALDGPSGGVELMDTVGVRAWNGPARRARFIEDVGETILNSTNSPSPEAPSPDPP